VVLALAESVSIQSTTITLASLGPSPSARRPGLGAALGREFATATLLGLASGGLVGGAAWLWKGDACAALVIGASIALAIVTACLIGVLLPWGVRLLGRDPKLASGPLVLASADVATLLFYFNIAERLLA
jgi:magnesium transporter